MTKSNRKLSTVSLILVAVLVFTALFNVVYIGGSKSVGAPNLPTTSATSENSFVQSDLNFDSLREQYINQELVQKSIASFDGDRWVIVELEGDTLYDKFKTSTRYNDFASYTASVEGQKAEANIKAEHTAFLKTVERHGIDYQVKYTYTAVANALAIKVNADGYNAIRQMSGVVDAYYVEYYDVPEVMTSSNAITNNANVYTTGIYNTEGIEEAGEGMVVAVLDTGLDYTHDAFQTMPNESTAKFTKEYIESIVSGGSSNQNLISSGYNKLMAVGTADDFYYNLKVPFAYDYADDDPNVYPAYSNHGTHVAGIVAGKSDYVVNETEDDLGNTVKETFVGVAPQAQLVICKVFTDDFDNEYLGGANTMSILAALNDCTVLGVDVINMSLGTSAGFTQERGDDAPTRFLNAVYNNIESLGISLVVAASNDYSSGYGGGYGTNLASNPDSGTVGSPSTYSAALSVASINGRKSSYITAQANRDADDNSEENPVAFITNSSNEFGQEYDFIELLYDIASKVRGEDARGTTLKFKFVPIRGAGRSTDYASVASQFVRTNNTDRDGNEDTVLNEQAYATLRSQGYDGVIALVQRGTTTFNEKVQAAMAAGAQACVIYNNVAGTIRMSLGDIDDPIPTCSITMDAGNAFLNAQRAVGGSYGTIYINSEYLAGPFMSDFSSWGPTPSLELKPEITAHGGEIISAVPSGYDKLSGTSMAAPNMAGAIALLRQNIQSRAAYSNLSGKELNTLVNQMLMSTATIALNDEGNPYSPRKQGAGLAGIADAINSEGYITVNGKDRTKIELGDDPSKKGEYVLDFVVHNITNSAQTYEPITYVMTESMSSDGKTVAEKAYMLTDMCDIKYYAGSTQLSGSNVIVVPANSTLSVRVVITLNSEARKYIDSNFVNGMYVEGFVSLQSTGDTKVTLGVPYLAFYGDWTAAPLFDYDIYEIAENEQEEEDELRRIKASAATTLLYGRYYEDKYYLPLGTYIYAQEEDDVEIYPSRDKIAISMFDDHAGHSIYELTMVYAGLLRGAAEMYVVITDDATGEAIYTDTLYNVNKSYASGGSNVGARIAIELNPGEWGMKNNSTYSVSVTGKLDYEGGENPARASFEFPFTVDYESPEMLGYRIRYMPYTENKVTKYKIYMDVDVYDNQYVSAVLPCYRQERATGLYDDKGNPIMETYSMMLTDYPIAVNGQKGEISTVSFEITDIYEEYVKTGALYLQVEDYALNANSYQILIGQNEGEDAMSDPISVDFVTDNALKKGPKATDGLGTEYYTYTLTMTRNSLYTLNADTNPANATLKSLTWEVSDSNSAVKASGNEIWAGNGTTTRATLTLKNTTSLASAQKIYAIIFVIIGGSQVGREPTLESIQLNAAMNGSNHITSLNPGGSTTPELDLNPNQSMKLTFEWTPWYCNKPDVTWTSSNPNIVSVDENGTITAHQRGQATITVTAVDRPSVSRAVRVVVGREYSIINYTLYEWYGSGDVVIPSDLNIMYIDEDCFKGREDITSVVLPKSLTELAENAFLGCRNLKYVEIPGQCTSIKENAFAGCTALETVKLGLFVDSEKNELGEEYAGTITLGRHAFQNCVSLKTIENETRITAIYEEVFAGCSSLESIDLSNLRLVKYGAFRDCTMLSNVVTNENTALGQDMFKGCTALESFDFYGSSVPARMFSGCENLSSITFHNGITSIALNAFGEYTEQIGSTDSGTPITKTYGATALENVTLPNGYISIDADAFKNCAELATVTLSKGTRLAFERNTPFAGCESFVGYVVGDSDYYSVSDGILYDKNVNTLIAVPYAKTSISLPGSVTAIADGALAGVNIESITLNSIQSVGRYAFADNTSIVSVKLPSGLKEIPDGLFDGCLNLEEVTADDNFAQVTRIGEYAFRDCGKLESFIAENATEIGDGAFLASGIKALPSSKLTKVGASAFASTKLTSVNLPNNIALLGESAFAGIETLETVVLGAIAAGGMEEGVFESCPAITSVEFKDGTVEVGAFAFAVEDPVSARINVILPSSVKTIGMYAFFNRGGIVINLENVQIIDAFAFAYNDAESEDFVKGIQTADLSSVKEIGYAAFICARLESVNLPKAEVIGSNAFYYNTNLTSVTFGALRRIGEYAFANSKLTTVTLPNTFNSRTYEYEWTTVDEKGNPDLDKSRRELNYSAGAFAGISTLKAIFVADGNDTFFDVDGVLYSRVANGYVLEQYPVARADEDNTYTVIDNTVIIGGRAFEGVTALDKVVLPYTLTTVGSYAFYEANVKEYIFNGVEAPTLLAEPLTDSELNVLYAMAVTISGNGAYVSPLYFYLWVYFDREQFGDTNFYANFYNYAALTDMPNTLVEALYKQFGLTVANQDLRLTMTIPLNGRGYNGVWENFFSTINTTATNMPDNTSHKAMEAIEALQAFATLDNIKNMSYDAVNVESELGKLAAAARVAYNNIVLSDQIELMTEYLDILTSYESALRNRKAELGYQVNIKELKVSSLPDKIRYNVGERFDITGMVISVIYDDGSEVALVGNNYTITPEIIRADTEYVRIQYRDAATGQTVYRDIYINVNSSSNGNTDETGSSNGLSGGAIAGIVIGVILGVALIAGAVVVVLLVKKNKISLFGAKKDAENKNEDKKNDSAEKSESDSSDSAEEKADGINDSADQSAEAESEAEQKAEEPKAENSEENPNVADAESESAGEDADGKDEIANDNNDEATDREEV